MVSVEPCSSLPISIYPVQLLAALFLSPLLLAFLTELEEKEEKEIQRLLDNQRRMRSLAHEQGHSPGQYEKTVEVRTH